MKRLLVFVVPAVFGLTACVVAPVRSQPPAYIPPPPPRYVPPAQYVPPPPPQYVPPPPPEYVPPPPPDGYAPPPDGSAYGQDPAYAQTDEDYVPPPPPPVVSVYVDPPNEEPEPIGVPWAPPPMLVEEPGPMPFYGAYWTGGYWVWQGDWVWAHGRWLAPPYAGYGWTQPYYENRGGIVVFVPGYWRAPGAVFIAPAIGVTVLVVEPRPGVVRGPRCDGPEGVFVPPPPGSRHGIIVPAPLGTAPAVVVGSPPALHRGMQVRGGDEGHVQIVAPAGVTANGRPLTMAAPRLAHLAAAQQPVVRVAAPVPASPTPIRNFSPRQGFVHLPEARPVRPVVAQPALVQRPAANPGQRFDPAQRQQPAQRPGPQPVQQVPQSPPQQAGRQFAPQPGQQPSQEPSRQPAQRPEPNQRPGAERGFDSMPRQEPAVRPAPQPAPQPRIAPPVPPAEAPRVAPPQRPIAQPPQPAVAPRPAAPAPQAPAPKPRNEREEKERHG